MMSLLTETDLKAVIEICALVALIVNGIQTKRGAKAAEHASAQLVNNGGSTIKDAIDRIEKRVGQLDDGQLEILARQSAQEARLARIEDHQ